MQNNPRLGERIDKPSSAPCPVCHNRFAKFHNDNFCAQWAITLGRYPEYDQWIADQRQFDMDED